MHARLSSLEGEGRLAGGLPLRRIPIRRGSRYLFVRPDDVDWCEAARNYVKLHTGDETYLYRSTLRDMEASLDDRFVRIHRSLIVNLDRVREVRSNAVGEWTVVLHDGVELPLGRTYRRGLIP